MAIRSLGYRATSTRKTSKRLCRTGLQTIKFQGKLVGSRKRPETNIHSLSNMTPTTAMTSSRPYLLRALHQWIGDNGLTPYIVVDASSDEVHVPRQFIENGKIVLNVSVTAVKDLQLTDEYVLFSARFSGTAHDIIIPVRYVLAIYARENGQGMVFSDEPNVTPPSTTPPATPTTPDKGPKKPKLRVVK